MANENDNTAQELLKELIDEIKPEMITSSGGWEYLRCQFCYKDIRRAPNFLHFDEHNSLKEIPIKHNKSCTFYRTLEYIDKPQYDAIADMIANMEL